MKIYINTPLVRKLRESVLEFLLINHPLDQVYSSMSRSVSVADDPCVPDKLITIAKIQISEQKSSKSALTAPIHSLKTLDVGGLAPSAATHPF